MDSADFSSALDPKGRESNLMIDSAVGHITTRLNDYLRVKFETTEDVVLASNIAEPDGTMAPQAERKLLVFLVNVEKDVWAKPQREIHGEIVTRTDLGYPPVFLNLYVMFAANFGSSNYMEALKMLSNTVSFFQRQPVFDHHVTPDLDPQIERLTMQIENLDIRDLSNLWGVLTGKYLPSVLYKVRMIAYDSDDVRAQVPALTAPRTSVAS